MTRRVLFPLFFLLSILFSVSCTPKPINPTPEANMPNPASVHCEQNKGKLELRQDASGGVVGMCVFPDQSECEEWAYFRSECKPGSELMTDIPYGRSCGNRTAPNGCSCGNGTASNGGG